MSNGRLTASEREAYALGCQRYESGEVEGALDALTRLLETRSGFADVHYMVGVLHERRGETELAMESLRAAVRLNPAYAEALLALAALHERGGDFERSRAYAERASECSRADQGRLDATTRGKLANLQAKVADAYAGVGEMHEAVEAYRKALDRCPEFHDIRHRLGIALREAGLQQQALNEFQRVLRGNPDFLEAHVQLGLTYYSLGRAQEALEQWAFALQRDPGLQDAQMYIRLVQGGRSPKDG